MSTRTRISAAACRSINALRSPETTVDDPAPYTPEWLALSALRTRCLVTSTLTEPAVLRGMQYLSGGKRVVCLFKGQMAVG